MNLLKTTSETIDIMMDGEICTVDSFKKILDALTELGYGDMSILLGNDTPLLHDSICINYMTNNLLIRNTYYDKKIVDAAEKLKDSIIRGIEGYRADCYHAGMNIKVEEPVEQKGENKMYYCTNTGCIFRNYKGCCVYGCACGTAKPTPKSKPPLGVMPRDIE